MDLEAWLILVCLYLVSVHILCRPFKDDLPVTIESTGSKSPSRVIAQEVVQDVMEDAVKQAETPQIQVSTDFITPEPITAGKGFSFSV